MLVEPYDPIWPSHFHTIKAFLENTLAGVHQTVEHVGSTAVLGMIAKPIIDIDVVIAHGRFPQTNSALGRSGYTHQGDLGIPGREAFKITAGSPASRMPAHHLYVCEEDASELHRHIAFRDFLKNHPDWRERLSRLKTALCIQHNNDRQFYMDGKSAMVQEITRLALQQHPHASALIDSQ